MRPRHIHDWKPSAGGPEVRGSSRHGPVQPRGALTHPQSGPWCAAGPGPAGGRDSRSGSSTAGIAQSLGVHIRPHQTTAAPPTPPSPPTPAQTPRLSLWYMEKDRNWFRNFWYMRPSGLRQKAEGGGCAGRWPTTPSKAFGAGPSCSPRQHDSRQERGHVMMKDPPAFDPAWGSTVTPAPWGGAHGQEGGCGGKKPDSAQFQLPGSHAPPSWAALEAPPPQHCPLLPCSLKPSPLDSALEAPPPNSAPTTQPPESSTLSPT